MTVTNSVRTEIAIREAVELLKKFEGFSGVVYKCPAGVQTIGYGFTDKYLIEKGKITREQGDIILENKVTTLLHQMANNCPKLFLLTLPAGCYGALASFTYNVGLQAFLKSTLLKKILEIRPTNEIAEQFKRWNKAGGVVLKGLVKRREREANTFCPRYKQWKERQYRIASIES